MSDTPHHVDPRPFDPGAEDETRPAEAALSARALFWRRFRRHRLAMVALVILAGMYLLVPFAEVIAPYGPNTRNAEAVFAPPQTVRLMHEGTFIGPFVYPQIRTLDMETFRYVYAEDTTRPQLIRFFCRGDPYRFWGLWDGDWHLACPPQDGTLYLLGTDRLGQDMASRLIYGARVSLTVGLIGVAISMTLGILFGGLAGYFGGWVDNLVQRLIELLRALPELPLWMALSAALPVNWSPLYVFIGITVILGLLDWPGLARAVRAKFLSLREEDYVEAAELMGAGPARVIGRHLVPNFASHLIASATLAIPGMILGETALSFLGLGVREPMTSWGLMLDQARRLEVIQFYPWVLAPVAPVVLVVLAFNFLGDGLRDAADPYQTR